MGQSDSAVKTRRVFYIPGYDPIPPRRYRELYRSESAAQGAISGYEISIAPRPRGARFGWSVQAQIEGHQTQSEIDVLVWSDIVQASMEGGIARSYAILARTAWTYIATGALVRLMQLRKGPVIAALYPVVMLLGQGGIAALLALGLYAIGARFGLPGRLVGGALGLGAAYGLLRWFKKMDGRFFAYYLMHDYGFSARWRGADPPQLVERVDEFADVIAEALEEAEAGTWDEVLLVGHSSGAHLGVQILAKLQREGRIPAGAPLGFLTLGQVVPMVSFLPGARALRRDLAQLSRGETFWLDVTAPGDGCAFALCDPVAVSGVAPEGQRWPLILSAAFTQTLSPERWRALRWRFFRLHFQYLCAFDRPGDYDYFAITAGPRRLADRFAGRAPSASRITRAASKYRDMAP